VAGFGLPEGDVVGVLFTGDGEMKDWSL
jgi:hypothetical protein